MNYRIIYRLTFILSMLISVMAEGQISHGGIPIQIIKSKSALTNSDLVEMPEVDNLHLREIYSSYNHNMLKTFHFAHPFQVMLTPDNSGKWYTDGEVNVWQLRIRSVGAYSLNLILNQYKLPEKARLFLISTDSGEIKGAYTSENNSESQTLAIEPVEGDELMVQYEEPVLASFPGKFCITQVAHDFIGITSSGMHRPLGVSGSCNVNINCDQVNGTENIRDAVCRIIIEGTEICSGTLINNTAKDGTPYVLTAYHCMEGKGSTPEEKEKNAQLRAQSSVFLFNYESPYCASVDGDVSRSISGSSLKSSFDSLDFALVRLNTVPPYTYRPYMSGWNRKNEAPTSSICIHHPLGDIKKIALDNNSAVTASFSSSYRPNGFWKILKWESGVTESGSSGGPLFDQNMQLIGTLTGGSATCNLPTNDYFEKFALAWDYRKEPNKQLKGWLDPQNSNADKQDGMPLYSSKLTCKPVTNFKDNDVHAAIQITDGITKKGYWSGTNLVGFTDFAEQYKFSKNCEVQGITLGVAKLKINTLKTSSALEVQVYEGSDLPETLLYSEKFDISKFWADAMNYLPFKTSVKTSGNFFVSFNIQQLNQGDTLAVYMANRQSDTTNSFFLKNQEGWSTYNSKNLKGNGSALLTELIVCNVDDPSDIEEPKPTISENRFFPNPLYGSSVLTVETIAPIECLEDIAVYDLLGKKQNVPITLKSPHNLSLNFTGLRGGFYFIHLEIAGQPVVGKIAYHP